MYIWEILFIVSLAGMVIILVRRLPQAVATARQEAETPSEQVPDLKSARLVETETKVSEAEKPVAVEEPVQSKTAKANPAPPKQKVTEYAREAQADKTFKAGDFVGAAEIYEELLREDALNMKLRNRLGLTYLELEQFHAARELFRTVLKEGGEGIANHHANLAMAEYGLGHHLTAIRHLKRAIAMAPNTKSYQDLLATIESERG
jgi:tetratricopeptide (TPR) repeat protein